MTHALLHGDLSGLSCKGFYRAVACVCVCVCLLLSITSLLCVLSSQLREEIDKYGIKIYQFPDCDSDEDEELKRQDKELKVSSVLVRKAPKRFVCYF